jgi:hypothetical protein
MNPYFICGTRKVIPGPRFGTWRVVCATCDGGGSVAHHVRGEATAAAVRDSNKPCPARRGCGAT